MYEITDNKITLTRGDTLEAKVDITKDGEAYTPKETDTITFRAKHAVMNASRTDYKDAEPVIVKDVPTETCVLKLDPADTKDLGFGKYVYEVSLTDEDGNVDTFIAAASLVLTPEVG